MRTIPAVMAALVLCVAANADFSFTQTRKTTGGMMAAMAGNMGPQATTISLKGQKIKTDDGKTATVIDLDAQTVTTMNHAKKTYAVKSVGDLAGGAGKTDVKIDVKETGEKKVVNGFNASEIVMTMEMDSAQTRGMGKMQLEIAMWLSPEVPGAKESRAFYEKNAEKFPWGALTGQGNPGMAAAMADVQKKFATMNGVMVQQVIKMKAPAGMPGMPPGASGGQMQAGMEKARAQLEGLAAAGGPAAEIAKQQLARMGPPPGAAGAAGGAAQSLIEMTIDSSAFSTAEIPDSSFAVPDGYTKN